METAAAFTSSAAAPAAPSRGRCVVRLRLPRAWTAEEDALLGRLPRENGFAHWHRVARRMATGRSARLCRVRWRHHLARDVYHRPFTARDDEELRLLVARFGSHGSWKEIGCAVYGRTSRVMKRRWKELREMAAAAKSRVTCCPPALPSDETAALQQGRSLYDADDVLASSFVVQPWHGRRGPQGRKPRVRIRLHGGLTGHKAEFRLPV